MIKIDEAEVQQRLAELKEQTRHLTDGQRIAFMIDHFIKLLRDTPELRQDPDVSLAAHRVISLGEQILQKAKKL